MLQIRSSSTLDGGDFGWLKAKHHFAVSPDGNPANKPLGALVVWNDDEIAPGTGFGLHGHANMEIVSYVRDGVVTHRDNMEILGARKPETCRRSAPERENGIPTQSRRRAATAVQIWLRPRANGGEPRWNTRHFPKHNRANQFVVLASGYPDDSDALPIRADARVLGATLRAGTQVQCELGDFAFAYLAPARGAVAVNGVRLGVGDGIAPLNEFHITISAEEDSKVILVVTD